MIHIRRSPLAECETFLSFSQQHDQKMNCMPSLARTSFVWARTLTFGVFSSSRLPGIWWTGNLSLGPYVCQLQPFSHCHQTALRIRTLRILRKSYLGASVCLFGLMTSWRNVGITSIRNCQKNLWATSLIGLGECQGPVWSHPLKCYVLGLTTKRLVGEGYNDLKMH